MELLDEVALERSPIVANNRMNRERVASGVNSYAKELGFDPVAFLSERLARSEPSSWLDLCCGRGRALIAGFHALSRFDLSLLSLHGVDLVNGFDDLPVSAAGCLRFEAASLHRWAPDRGYDLITCVHGLHYVGDKLAVVARAASWLSEHGVLAANLDLSNVRSATDRRFDRQVKRWFRQCGIRYDARRRVLSIAGARSIEAPFQFAGANETAGPNYTGQEAVDSYYTTAHPCENSLQVRFLRGTLPATEAPSDIHCQTPSARSQP